MTLLFKGAIWMMKLLNGLFYTLLIFGSISLKAQTEDSPEMLKLYLPAVKDIPVFSTQQKPVTWESTIDIISAYGGKGQVGQKRSNVSMTFDTGPYRGLPSIADGTSAIQAGRFEHKHLAIYHEKLKHLEDHPELGLLHYEGQSDDQYRCIKSSLNSYRSCVVTNWDGKVDFPSCIRSHVAIGFKTCCEVPHKDGTDLSQFEKGLCTKENYPWTGVLSESATANDPGYTSSYYYSVQKKINDNKKEQKRTQSSGRERALLDLAFQKMNSVGRNAAKGNQYGSQ
jgi:hypothetical protein